MDERPDCKCHGAPMWRTGGSYRCQVKRSAWARERYRSDPEFAESHRERNGRRIFAGENYMTTAASAEMADRMQAAVDARLAEFMAVQAVKREVFSDRLKNVVHA